MYTTREKRKIKDLSAHNEDIIAENYHFALHHK